MRNSLSKFLLAIFLVYYSGTVLAQVDPCLNHFNEGQRIEYICHKSAEVTCPQVEEKYRISCKADNSPKRSAKEWFESCVYGGAEGLSDMWDFLGFLVGALGDAIALTYSEEQSVT